MTRRDIIRGCLIGGAIGDALGAGIEFRSLAEIRQRFGPAGVTGYVEAYGRLGAITDDTQMTAFTVEGLIRASVRGAERGIVHVPSVVWFAYRRWLSTQQPTGGDDASWLTAQPELRHRRAPGVTVITGLDRALSDPLPGACAGSKGCGTVMRSAPFGLVGQDRSWIVRQAVECSELTHGHPTAGHASAALALMVDSLVRGSNLREAVAAAVTDLRAAVGDATETITALGAAADVPSPGLATGDALAPEAIESLGAGWVAEEALAIAVRCALAVDGSPESVRASMLAAVNHSGDSDSTGSLCGNLLGAAFGDEVFPRDWSADLEARGVLLQLADDLWFQLREPHAGDAWFRRYPGA